MTFPDQLRYALQPIVVCIAFAFSFASRLAAYADEPRWLGKASCAAATCHGGIHGNGPAWNHSLSTWESTDPYHANAGKLLENHQSIAIVARILGQYEKVEALPARDVRAVLEQRCVSCHAPSPLALTDSSNKRSSEDNAWQEKLIDGVSCEACHGPASNWIESHTRREFVSTSAEAKALGMNGTKSWLVRSDNCIKCHVGSRTADGVVRDMNHDLIAAGHPALRFDMSRYQYQLAPHWTVKRKGPEPMVRELPSVNEYHSAKLRTLAAVAKLSLERIADSKLDSNVPYPEFADFDCYQCHQSIQFNIRYRPSHLAWNTFYTSQIPSTEQAALPFTEIRLRSTDHTPLTRVFQSSTELSNQFALQDEMSALVTLQNMQQLKFPQATHGDWLEAAAWQWGNRISLLNIASDKRAQSSELRASLVKLSQILAQFESALASSPVAEAVRFDAKPTENPIEFQQLVGLYRNYSQQLENVIQIMQRPTDSGAQK